MADDDVLSKLDPILASAEIKTPWVTIVGGERDGERAYLPDYDMARELLAVPIGLGGAENQQTGRVAKALDAWIAYELRRGGFEPGAVWPRARQPRTLAGDLVPVEDAIDHAMTRLDELEDRLARYGEKAAKKGVSGNPPSLNQARSAVRGITRALPGSAAAHILGRFYVKQVDVGVSTWQHGPDVLVSSKTQFSSYLKNKNNRYEEAVGEGKNLRDRHPMAAMGFAHVVRTNIFEETGAFAYLRNQLARLRKPDGFFDATMLLAADWDDETLTLSNVEDPTEELSAPRFYTDLLNAVMENSPVDLHKALRVRKAGEPPPGGLPPSDEETEPEDAADFDPGEPPASAG